MKGNNKSKKQAKRKSRTMRAGVMGLLCVAGVGSLLGMAVFNGICLLIVAMVGLPPK